MTLTAYLKIGDIAGESRRAEHEDEIDVHGLQWKISQQSSLLQRVGRGRARARATVDALTCLKFTDASSPYLALACFQGRSFPEATLAVRKDSGEAHLDYLVITMENVTVSGYEMSNDAGDDEVVAERLGLTFEKVTYTYIVQNDDQSSGDEHEVEFDIAAAV